MQWRKLLGGGARRSGRRRSYRLGSAIRRPYDKGEEVWHRLVHVMVAHRIASSWVPVPSSGLPSTESQSVCTSPSCTLPPSHSSLEAAASMDKWRSVVLDPGPPSPPGSIVELEGGWGEPAALDLSVPTVLRAGKDAARPTPHTFLKDLVSQLGADMEVC